MFEAWVLDIHLSTAPCETPPAVRTETILRWDEDVVPKSVQGLLIDSHYLKLPKLPWITVQTYHGSRMVNKRITVQDPKLNPSCSGDH